MQVGHDDSDFVSSQESITSSLSTDEMLPEPAQSRPFGKKRAFEEGDIFVDPSVWIEEEDAVPLASTRCMVVPKTRRKELLGSAHKVQQGEDQENGHNDFEEADFLRPPGYIDEDIDMGDL